MKRRTIITLYLFIFNTSFSQNDSAGIFDDLESINPRAIQVPNSVEPAASQPDRSLDPTPQPQSLPVEPSTEPPPRTEILHSEPTLPLDIEKTIALGKAACNEKKWNEAQLYFESVLHNDPHNKEAVKWIAHIAEKKSAAETQSFHATRSRMLADVQSAWNTPKNEGKSEGMSESPHEPTDSEIQTQTLRNKLQSTRIPTITFQSADIQQVVLELSTHCRTLDSEGTGINLVTFGTSETPIPPITFSGTNLSALETLDIITQMTGMKYEVGPSMVTLTPVNYEPPQQMTSTELDVRGSVGTKMMAGHPANTSGLMDVRNFFSTTPFPSGSSAWFNPEFNILLVRNIPKYLDQVEALLEHCNRKAVEEQSQQVEIETKFIEVAEGALNELGFEWTVGTAGEYINNDTVAVPGGQQLFSDTLRSSEETFAPPIGAADQAATFNTLANEVGEPPGSGLVGTAGELLIQKVKGDTKVDLLIKALERQTSSDLLSAPRVLAKSGEKATIHVGEVRRFPTAYDVIIERYAQPSLLPLDYTEYKTGVILEVTPELDAANGTINLKLAPELRELAGFDEQHVGTLYPTADFDLGSQEEKPGYGLEYVDYLIGKDENLYRNSDRLIARQPVFKSRKVETAVTIEDGSTIAMGGLIKENVESFVDSVPFLGKIPLIGRLFRSEGEKKTKRNLLIFVTASQVDATGSKQPSN